jgi:hypothetical protein
MLVDGAGGPVGDAHAAVDALAEQDPFAAAGDGVAGQLDPLPDRGAGPSRGRLVRGADLLLRLAVVAPGGV